MSKHSSKKAKRGKKQKQRQRQRKTIVGGNHYISKWSKYLVVFAILVFALWYLSRYLAKLEAEAKREKEKEERKKQETIEEKEAREKEEKEEEEARKRLEEEDDWEETINKSGSKLSDTMEKIGEYFLALVVVVIVLAVVDRMVFHGNFKKKLKSLIPGNNDDEEEDEDKRKVEERETENEVNDIDNEENDNENDNEGRGGEIVAVAKGAKGFKNRVIRVARGLNPKRLIPRKGWFGRGKERANRYLNKAQEGIEEVMDEGLEKYLT